MELLGMHLEKFMCETQKIDNKIHFKIMYQSIECIEFLHRNNIFHRDIKPKNFVLNKFADESKLRLYILDLGLSSSTTKIQKGFVGTRRYASVGVMKSEPYTRKDDLESLGYSMIYMLRDRNLPWRGIEEQNKKKRYNLIMTIKEKSTLQELCEGIEEPYWNYMDYIRKMNPAAIPDYEYLKKLF